MSFHRAIVVFPILFWQAIAALGEVYAGSRACAPCHAEIYRTYMATGMARTSGRTGTGNFQERIEAASVWDDTIGANYRIARAGDVYRMEFARPSSGVKGSRDLKWFIGSGNVGRSYLFATDGFLFQAPVSYYSAAARWDLSPGFAGKSQIDLARPVESPCLQCHATGVQSIPGTQNKYLDSPFQESGVGCERCHGAGQQHIESVRSGKTHATQIVNPVRLSDDRRDSVCLQCHLTGVARVARPNAGPSSFRPGDLLSDHLTVFVSSTSDSAEKSATDHAEQLANSKCRKVAGTRLWCGSCHDPHSTPDLAGRVAFYRQGCLNCHEQKGCTHDLKARAAVKDDCASCHMPKGRSREGEHVVYTDHRIRRRGSSKNNQNRWDRSDLKSFWQAPERDRALAYASLASDQPQFGRRALELLEKLESQGTQDAAVLAQLAQFYDVLGKADRAFELYERTLRLDPLNPVANANLAIYRVQRSRRDEAIALWQNAFSRNPSLIGPGINAALEQFRSGDLDSAEYSVQRVLRFHPDLQVGRELLARIRSSRRP